MAAHRIQGSAGALYVTERGGGGLPVLFVHSSAGNADHWSEALAHLAPTRRAVALDLRGHGRSDEPADGDRSIEALARDVTAAADSLGLERFVLAGHSLGGSVALACADANRGRVQGLLLVDTAGDARGIPPEQAQGFLAMLRSQATYRTISESFYESILVGSRPAVHDRVLADLRATPPETVAGGFAALLDFDPVRPAQTLGIPILAVVAPRFEAEISLHRVVTTLPVRYLPGTGHWLQLDDPLGFHRILDEFLADVDARANAGL